ncbi:MAG TPA: UrcA family protein [Caulobacteraceae bacterium]|nr:UrcA family protein [Caulobacteraceae bacterium]
MSRTVLGKIATLSAVSAVAALTFGFVSVSHAQPYSADSRYADQDAAVVGGITVRPSYRAERSWSTGAEIVWARTSRVVDVSDLDLSTGWGQRVLYHRVSRAAADACDELENTPGLVPTADDSNADCVQRAIDRAMSEAPIPGNGY